MSLIVPYNPSLSKQAAPMISLSDNKRKFKENVCIFNYNYGQKVFNYFIVDFTAVVTSYRFVCATLLVDHHTAGIST